MNKEQDESVNETDFNDGELEEEIAESQEVLCEKAEMLGIEQGQKEEIVNSNENDNAGNTEDTEKDAHEYIVEASNEEEMKVETDRFDEKFSESREPNETGKEDEEGTFHPCNVIIKTETDETAICPVCNLSLPECQMSEHICGHDNGLQCRCHVCKLTFSDERSLNAHITVHDSEKQQICHVFTKEGDLVENVKMEYEEGKLTCLICKLKYEDDASLNAHLATHGMLLSVKDEVVCHTGDKEVSEMEIGDHMLNHIREGSFDCQICLLSFNNKDSLIKHYDCHCDKSPNECVICEKDYATKIALQNHMLSHASKTTSQQTWEASPVKTVASKLMQKHNQFCPFCGNFYSSILTLDQHLKSCSSEKYHKVCQICKQSFSDEEKLKEHALIHTAEMPYRCEICDKCFKLSGSLRNHRATHLESKPYVCQQCGKGFIKPCFLKTHEASHSETRDRPFVCDICDRGFTTAYNLKKHKKTHEPAELKDKFTCPVCGVSMTMKSSLDRHMLKHTGKNKLHRCEICTKWYNTSHALKLHMYTHTGELPHKCEICDKRFSESTKVKRHMLVHTGERAYACEICDKAYKCQQDLNHHMAKHTGERKYLCSECGNAFAKHRDLKYHMQSKHDIDITNRSNMEV